ncbi:peptide chain release factor H [Ruegeria arenilitoris]|uniref:peptide chain release factor H n=1 Tax=Ruegeria arenilitoris TaxID=1173585 RepID=UPI00147F4C8D|nr:peptide chain release factor H [Ruegeria arenilitoris]
MTAAGHLTLLITSGSGPAECQQAVAGVLNAMRHEAEFFAVDLDASGSPTKHGFKSAVVLLGGADAKIFANRWRGTIRWRAKSNLRPQHKRANWFVGVFDLAAPALASDRFHERDVKFETFRAGGPGGQHQNTTDSAVRAVHGPTGLAVVAREERSQHRNKSLALARLRQLLAARIAADEVAQKAARNQLHHTLERGNPVRCFKGHDFREEQGG